MITTCGELKDLRLDADKLNIILPYGNGDSFNALLYLQKYPPQIPYELVIKKNQVTLVTLVLERFERLPTHIHVIGEGSGNLVAGLVERFPQLKWVRGMPPLHAEPACVILWTMPDSYHKLWPLDERDIAAWTQHFATLSCDPGIESDAIVFCISANDPPPTVPDFARISAMLAASSSLPQYSNVSGIANYGAELVPGTTPITLRWDQLVKLAYRKHAKTYFIGLRSGLFDLVRFSDFRKVVFYSTHIPSLYTNMRVEAMQFNARNLELQYGSGIEIDYDNLGKVIDAFLFA